MTHSRQPHYRTVTAFAPATVANVACGFDVLGFALESPGDEVTARFVEHISDKNISGEQTINEHLVSIVSITSDDGLPELNLPTNPLENTASGAVLALLKALTTKIGIVRIELSIRKRMPAGSGMGSSAASAAAAVLAVNALFGNPKTPEELVEYGMKGEAIASGSEHADNVAPAIMGGIVLVRGYNPVEVIRIPAPEGLYCTIVRPHTEVSTKEARGILPKEIPMKAAITQWANLAGLIAGLMKSDFGIVSRSLTDVVAEPHRAALIPGFFAMKEAALRKGALGCSISGSGPSVFALSSSRIVAEHVGDAMLTALQAEGVQGTLYLSSVLNGGPYIVHAA